ncbi:MAG: hypothetical protein IT376_12050 [Polyangiaceae bacterium]|nr:hypothetical protein [Polyangiaceae bacterium]
MIRAGTSLALAAALAAAGCGAAEGARVTPPEPRPGRHSVRAGARAAPSAEGEPPPASTAAPGSPDSAPCAPLVFDAGRHEDQLDVPVPAVADYADGAALGPFWEKLAAVARGRAAGPVRVFFYGDSNLALDQVSGELRRRLQARFGDGGHGYMGAGSPARGYRHMDVRRSTSGHWVTHIYSHHDPTGEGFGAGGMVATTRARGARVAIRTADAGAPVGTAVTHLGVFYVAQPGGGRVGLRVDGGEPRVVDAEAVAPRAEWVVVEAPDGPHELRVEALDDRKEVRLLGLTLERAARPGIVVDAYGLTGSTYHHLARMDHPIDRRMLELRKPDLVLFLIGTNHHRFDENPVSADRVLRLLREVDPAMPVVVMTPPDRVKSKHSTQSHRTIVEVSAQLERLAREQRVGFWDFRGAMGGDGAMHAFFWKGLAGEDLIHLSPAGARVMGGRLAHALEGAFAAHLANHPRAGCPRP